MSSNNPHKSSEDRLTTLPKVPIDAILISLPLKDAIRTSVLSRAWRFKWCDLSRIQFRVKDVPLVTENQSEYDAELVKIIDQVLLLHRGTIHTFILSVNLACCTDINRWILFLSRNGIRKLTIDKWEGPVYNVGSHLYSCKELTYLELFSCSLNIPTSFSGFRYLTFLYLNDISFTDNGLETLVSKCPLLHYLILTDLVGCTRLKLCASKLIRLSVEGAFIDISFQKTPVLREVLLDMSIGDNHAKGGEFKLVRVLGSLHGIRKLELLGDTYQILVQDYAPVRTTLPSTHQLLHLSLDINLEEPNEMLAAFFIFRSSPSLKKLCINSMSDDDIKHSFWEAQEDLNCLFSQLQFFNVTQYIGTAAELKFIELVLANAPVLETVQIKFRQNMVDVVESLKKLLRFRRVSTKAEVVISE